MGVLFWRRVSRLGHVRILARRARRAGASSQQHATLVLHDLKRPLTLEVIPSATYSRRQTRATPDGASARRLESRRRRVA